MNRKWKIGAALIGLAAAVALVLAIPAMGNRPPKHPNPPPPPPVLPPPPPSSPPVCPDGLPPTPGEGAFDPNDDCARAPSPPPPPAANPPPPAPTPVVPLPLKCGKDMTEISRSATQIVCGKIIVKVREKPGRVKIKKVLVPKFPKVCVPKKHVPPVAG